MSETVIGIGVDVMNGVKLPHWQRLAIALEFAARFMRQAWPGAIFEDPGVEKTYTCQDIDHIPFHDMTDLGVYRSTADYWRWHDGAVDNTMFYFCGEAGQLRVLLEDYEDKQALELLRELACSLRLLSPLNVGVELVRRGVRHER